VTSTPPVASTMSSEHGLTTREKAAATRRARRELLALIHAGHLNITDVLARTDDNLIAKTPRRRPTGRDTRVRPRHPSTGLDPGRYQ
jgi:hypothetical protein